MIRTVVYDGERIESAIKRFRKVCEREGLMKDMKRHEFYEKPSEKNKRKRRRSKRPDDLNG